MTYQCPMCGERLQDDLKVFTDHVESEIVDLIKKDHSDWTEKDGTCPKCYKYYKDQLKGE